MYVREVFAYDYIIKYSLISRINYQKCYRDINIIVAKLFRNDILLQECAREITTFVRAYLSNFIFSVYCCL